MLTNSRHLLTFLFFSMFLPICGGTKLALPRAFEHLPSLSQSDTASPSELIGKTEFRGRVVDSNGAPLEGVTVHVSDQNGKIWVQTVTNELGEFSAAIVVPSHLRVRLKHPDFNEGNRELKWQGSAVPVVFDLQPAALKETITVTATRGPLAIKDIPSTAIVVKQTDLQRSPAVTLDDTLRQIPAFSLFRRTSSLVAHPTTQGVSLRGIGPSGVSRTLVLWDGSPLNDPFGGWVYWRQLDKNSLEQIEVVPSGASSLYGSSALGGVIQLFSRVPEDSQLELDVHGGSAATAGGDLLASYAKGPWGLNFTGSFLHTDGYFVVSPKDRGLVDDRAGSVHYALRGSSYYKPSPLSNLSLHLNHFAEDRDNGTVLQKNATDMTTLRARYRREQSNGQRWELSGYGLVETFNSNFTAISANRQAETLTLDQVVPARSAGGSVQWTGLLLGRHLVTSGLDWQWVRGNSEELGYAAGLPFRFVVVGGNQQLGGIYLQDLFTPSSRWMVQLGMRLDGWTNYDAQRRETFLSTGSQTDSAFASQKRGTANPRLGVSYHLSENLTLRGSYYHSFRAPTLNELYRSFRVGNVVTLANDQLGTERIKGFEAGLDWRLGARVSGRVVGFWNDLEHPVSNVTTIVTPALITRVRQNVGETRAQGIETEASFQISRDWAFRAAYLLSDSHVTEFPANRLLESRWLPQVPRHRVAASMMYSNLRAVDAFVSARFVGVQFDDDLNLLPLGNFTVLDFHLSRQINSSLRAYFSAENIFDRRFAVARTPVESIGAPRLLHAGIKLTF